MSGSPVFASDPFSDSVEVPRLSGQRELSKSDDILHEVRGGFLHFAGIYSGRAKDQSEVGIVWRAGVIAELLESRIPSNYVPLSEG